MKRKPKTKTPTKKKKKTKKKLYKKLEWSGPRGYTLPGGNKSD